MNETVMTLVDAIKNGDAIATEQAFAAAMAEKLSARIDDMRQSVASTMFTQVVEQPAEAVAEEAISEEEYNALTEEQRSEYQELEEAKTKFGAMRSYIKNDEIASDHYGDMGTTSKERADASNQRKKDKKFIKKAGGDMDRVKQASDRQFRRRNGYM